MLIRADARHIPLAAESVQTVVTSPPYWGLRDYGLGSAGIGLEPTPEAYIENVRAVFREIWRVLKTNGCVFLNLGDSYAGSWGNYGGQNRGNGKQRDIVNGSKVHQESYDGLESWRPPTSSPPRLKPKDLCGIPWRTALALQAPYEIPTCVISETDRAWLAAMFDGEGCIGIRRFDSYRKDVQQIYQDGFVVYTVVTNSDTELLDRCIEVTGLGKTKPKQKAGNTDKRGIVSRRDSYGWRLDGNPAIKVIRAIYPYLIAKRKQACIAYTLDCLNKRGHGSVKVPPEIQAKKVKLKELINRCNQRQPVDLPNWVEEPKPEIQPGWYLRSDIIWAKPNPMPESVRDRPTRSHEYIFLLSKSERYHYDAASIQERGVGRELFGNTGHKQGVNGDRNDVGRQDMTLTEFRNRRTVWTVATQGYSGSHFATFPEKLIEPCILAGCPPGGTVLDPFVGSGTTVRVAERLNRRGVGCDLTYQDLAVKRLRNIQRELIAVTG